MSILEKLGKEFVITTELGPVKGAFADESIRMFLNIMTASISWPWAM